MHETLKAQSENVPGHELSELQRHWYAVYTRASRERKTAEQFECRGLETFMPHYRVVRRWKNRCTKNLDLPLFPGYLFVRIVPAERIRVLEVPSVVTIVGSGRAPMALPDFEIESLRAGLHLRCAEPHPHLVVGRRARIRGGPLSGMEGVVVRKNNNLRVVLTLDLIMQSLSVEVDGSELEAVSGAPLLRSGGETKGCESWGFQQPLAIS